MGEINKTQIVTVNWSCSTMVDSQMTLSNGKEQNENEYCGCVIKVEIWQFKELS